MGKSTQITDLLNAMGEDPGAANRLMPLVYDQLRELAQRYLARERADHTLQPTALVHEAYLKLVNQSRVDWNGRTHFFAIGAQMMRRILVDHARTAQRQKRGGGRQRVTLEEGLVADRQDEDILALNDALERLETLDTRQAKIVELRFFGGLTVAEVARELGLSKRTIENEWTMVRAWLRRELSHDDGNDT